LDPAGALVKALEVVYRYDQRRGPDQRRPANATAARRRLDDGNRAFAALLEGLAKRGGTLRRVIPVDPENLGLPSPTGGAPKQRPFAAVLGCADARVPVELIFGQGPNDLFVVRVAGNVLGSEVLGSLGYAITQLGGSLKVVAVLGHSGCGAVTAAVDVYLSPRKYLAIAANHALRSVVDRMLVVVQASARRLSDVLGAGVVARPGYRAALIESAIVVNAALSAYTLRHEIAQAGMTGIRALFGIYLLETHRVWAPRLRGRNWYGLAEPPRDEAAFFDLGKVLARSERIAALLR